MAAMVDMAPGIAEMVQDEFERLLGNSEEIARILTFVETGKATYEDANEFAVLVGEMLQEAFLKITPDMLPDGKMYYNIAQRVVAPQLQRVYDKIADATQVVQQELNRNAGLGLMAYRPKLNSDRAEGIIRRLADAEQFEDVAWILGEPVVNFSQNVINDSIKINADFQKSVGLNPIITRLVMGNCCKWCASLAGTYSYDDLPRDIYRRHEYCRCMVIYDPGDGRKQNVHTKEWQEDPKLIERRQQFGMKTDDAILHPIHPLTGERYNVTSLGIDDEQFGKKTGRHARDFGLNPASARDREVLKQIVYDIWQNADERCYGEWREQQYPVLFHIKGDDVVLEDYRGDFVTIMKGGVTNARVKIARKR